MTVRILDGDVRDRLRDLPDASVQCCVTSPPYYGLRDYGVPGQIGLEPTLAEYIANMVAVFREVRRVLRDDGTLWLNIGDSYAAARGGTHQPAETLAGGKNGYMPDGKRVNRGRGDTYNPTRDAAKHGLKHKDLMMVPARLALALQDDGWYLRSDIIWHKPNPMPESVTDRPTSAHEHIFLLTKSRKYFYDADAIRTEPTEESVARLDRADLREKPGWMEAFQGNPPARLRRDKQRGHGRRHDGFNDRLDAMPKDEQQAMGANARNVWTIATKPFSEAHFATFPPEIPERCIKAGSRAGDTILDPFLGSGTTLLVADRLGRDGIGIELNPTYAAMARRRIEADCPMFAEVCA